MLSPYGTMSTEKLFFVGYFTAHYNMVIENTPTLLFGSGFMTSLVLVDIAIVLCGLLLMKVLVLPTVQTYKKCKSIDKLFGTDKGNWFYGHLFKVRSFSLKNCNFRCAIIRVLVSLSYFFAILRHFPIRAHILHHF